MASKKVSVDISVDGSDATKTMGELKNSLEAANESSKSLKAQLKEMTLELQGLEPGTQRFQELATAAGKLKDQIADTNSVIQATAGSATENLSTAFTKTAGVGITAFEGVGGAMAMFGSDGEKIQEMMGRLQGAMAIGQALKDFGALGDTFTDIKSAVIAAAGKFGLITTATVAQAGATTAQAGATTGATVAQNALNLSMLANPIFLVIAGVAALVAAFVIFSGEAETAEASNDRINASYERTAAASQAAMDALKQANSTRLKLMEIEGSSEKELHDERLSNMLTEKTQRTFQIQDEAATINKKIDQYKQALKEENWELAKKISDEIKQHRDKYKTLNVEQKKYFDDVKIENAQFAADEAKKAEEEAAKAEQRREAANAKRKAAIGEIRKAEQEVSDAKLSEEDKEIVNVERKYKALLDTARSYGQSTVKLEEGRRNELKVITDKYDKAEEEKKAATLKTQQEGRDKYYNYLDSLETDNSVKRMMALDKEIEQLDAFLATKTITQEQYDENVKNATTKAEGDITKIKKDELDKQTADKKAVDDKAIEDEQKRIDKIKSTLADMSVIFQAIRAEGNALGVDLITTTLNGISTFVELSNKKFDSLLEKVNAYTQAIGGVLQGIVGAFSEANKAKLDDTLASIEQSNTAEADALTKKYNSGVISREEYDKQIDDLDKASKKKELDARKKAFEQDKKTKIASATIAGITGAVAAFTGAMSLGPIAGPIVGGILAAAVAGMTALNISKISKTKFDGGGDGPAPAPSVGGGGGGEASSPKFQPTQFYGLGQTSQTSGGGGGGMMKVYVSETDITSTQNKVKVVEDRATIK